MAARITRSAPTAPIKMDSRLVMLAQLAITLANPPKIPLMHSITSVLPCFVTTLYTMPRLPPAKEARVEVMVILIAMIHFTPLTPKVAPWLNAIQAHLRLVEINLQDFQEKNRDKFK